MLQPTPVLCQVQPRSGENRCRGEVFSGVRRLLVARADRLGDLVLTLPAIRALRRAYPRTWLGVLVSEAARPLTELMDDADEIMVDPGNAQELQERLVRFRADLLVCVSRGSRIPWAARRAGVPSSVGTGYRYYSGLFERRVDEHRRRESRHEVEYALSFAHRAGAPSCAVEFPLTLSEQAADAARNWITLQRIDAPFVILHPGSGGSCPAWPISHHIQLATLLEGHGRRVVFSIGPEDAEVSAAIDDEHPRIRRLPRFSGNLVALAALMSSSAAVVASSTGPAHLAAALQVPVLAFHAPWSSCGVARWGPYSPNGWAIVADHPEARTWSRRRRKRLGNLLMEGISPSTALRCVEAMLEGRNPEP